MTDRREPSYGEALAMRVRIAAYIIARDGKVSRVKLRRFVQGNGVSSAYVGRLDPERNRGTAAARVVSKALRAFRIVDVPVEVDGEEVICSDLLALAEWLVGTMEHLTAEGETYEPHKWPSELEKDS